ncbi:hypothetical protein A4H97_29685 [Niastella yeongjuensis]|uniref:Uncharacterized protein n=1 Tax=Niastella yeongjuensis TaxID=354355 RepID=A0A1V9EPQ6_9BACT|nr:hypothetical protein [Niastella yeongjuensis]OQP48012.1 hypothetical protein A4H97_29685 [Niastella yeongjuensis]SEO23469.1 hypothetical protein SAMN05660816_02336 [Niastella yeongjuensis]
MTHLNSKINFFVSFIFLWVHVNSYCQSERDLLTIAIPEKFLFIKPLNSISLDRWDIIQQTSGYLNELKEHVDTSVFFSIIENISKLHNATWKQQQFDSTIIVRSKNGQLNVDSVLTGKRSYTKRDIKYFKRLVKKYHHTPPPKRLIISYSRPVFDSSCKYAIMQYHVAKSGFGVQIFHYTSEGWKNLGLVVHGAY